jgi:xanthine dehydrogenase accessory factor
MKEINDIIRAYETACAAGKKAALATVVHVEGSSYRRPGARMLVTDDGMLTGTISGGCLEGDALRKALLAINEQKNKLVTYDTSDEEDARFGVQLGCNGIVHILFEPIFDDNPDNPIQLLKRVAAQRQTAVLVSLFSLENKGLQPGLCMLQIAAQRWVSASSGLSKDILADLQSRLVEAFSLNKSITKQYAADLLTAYIELLHPPVSLIICGAGNDAIPVVQAANLIGFDATIIDGRQTHANLQRFPTANAIIVSKAEQALAQVALDERTAWVLMTHNYNYDLEVLTQLMETNCRYIGILGPKKKLQRMLDEVAGKGILLTEEKLNKIYSPVGLDLGAETAEEIAISITAEVNAVFTGRGGQSLRDKEEAIHSRDVQITLKR